MAGLILVALWVGIELLVVRHPKLPAHQAALTAKCSTSGTPTAEFRNGLAFEIMGVATAEPCRVWAVGQTIKGANTAGIVLFRSNDSGNHFRRTSFGGVGDNPIRLAFAPDGSAWIVGGHFPGGLPRPMVLRSSDGGDRWQEMSLPVGAGPMQGISFSNGKIWVWGYGYGNYYRPGASDPDGVVLISSDGGRTWSEKMKVRQVAGKQPFIGPVAASGLTVIVLGSEGDKGLLWSSRDGGQTFKRADLGLRASHLSVVGPDAAYVLSGLCTPPCNPDVLNLLETTDGGLTWKQTQTVALGVMDLTFLSGDVGFAVFRNTATTMGLYQTNDAALSWRRVSDLPFAGDLWLGHPTGSSCQDPRRITCNEDGYRGFVIGPPGLIVVYGSTTIHRVVAPLAEPPRGSR
jgi:photosystem II stability/assembly factor-like uncharacterized protein